GTLEHELVESLALGGVELDKGRIAHESHDAGNRHHLGSQLLDDLVGIEIALLAGFELHEQEAAVPPHPAPGSADRRHECFDVRLLQHYINHLLLLKLQLVKGDSLGTLGRGEDGADIVGREKSHGHSGIQPDRDKGHEQCDDHGCAPELQNGFERTFIKMQQTVEKALHDVVEPAVPLFSRRFDETAAEHGSKSLGNHTGNENGNSNGDGKFMQHA